MYTLSVVPLTPLEKTYRGRVFFIYSLLKLSATCRSFLSAAKGHKSWPRAALAVDKKLLTVADSFRKRYTKNATPEFRPYPTSRY